MIFADIELSRRLERAEGLAGAAYTEARRRLEPRTGAIWQEVGSALVLFDGPDSPVTQTFGLGLAGEVTAAELDRIEGFFAERGAPVHHEISPLADESVWPLLSRRGYAPIEFTSLLYRDLVECPPDLEQVDGIEVRPAGEADADMFTRITLEGWSHIPGLSSVVGDLVKTMGATVGLRRFLAFSEGEPVAAAAMNLQGSTALFTGACTIPAARGRGAQRALLNERLRSALAAGCEIAAMGAQSGSGSQRNAERAGFRIAYTRTKWQLNIPSS